MLLKEGEELVGWKKGDRDPGFYGRERLVGDGDLELLVKKIFLETTTFNVCQRK